MTAIVSLVKAVLLQPLPYGDPDRLVMVWGKIEKGGMTNLSGPEVRDYTAANDYAEQLRKEFPGSAQARHLADGTIK